MQKQVRPAANASKKSPRGYRVQTQEGEFLAGVYRPLDERFALGRGRWLPPHEMTRVWTIQNRRTGGCVAYYLSARAAVAAWRRWLR